jgi:hypothetical protein
MLLISTKSPQKKKDFPIFFAINDLFRLLEAVKTLASLLAASPPEVRRGAGR